MFCTASKTFVNLSFTLLFVFLATFTSSPTMISQLRSNFLLQYISSNQRKVPPIDYWLFSLSVIVGIIQQSIFVLVVLFCFVSHHKDHWAIAIFVTYVRLFRPGIVYNDAAFCCPDPKCPPCESYFVFLPLRATVPQPAFDKGLHDVSPTCMTCSSAILFTEKI